jgi:hypothetical protein
VKNPFTVGIDWGDIGRKALGGGHIAGKVLLSAFGAGAAVQPLDQLEASHGLLPQWATQSEHVDKPDYVVFQQASAPRPVITQAPDKVAIFGGSRFSGTGYVPSAPLGTSFSFGITSPTRVEITSKGQTTAYTDVQQILFLGGIEGSDTVLGERVMTKEEELMIGAEMQAEVSGDDFTAVTPDGSAYTQPGFPATPYAQPTVPVATAPIAPAPAADYSRYSANRAAAARLAAAQARLAAAQAQQAFTVQPVTLPQIQVPSLNLNLDQGSFAMPTDQTVSGMNANLPGEHADIDIPDPMADDAFTEVILGDDMDPADGDTEVFGDDSVGMTAKQRQKLLRYMERIKKTILTGDSTEHALLQQAIHDIMGGDLREGVIGPLEIEANDYMLGTDVCGATPIKGRSLAQHAVKAPTAIKQTSVPTLKGRKTLRHGSSKNKSPHKLAMVRASHAMNRALRAGSQAQNRAALYKPKTTAVHGDPFCEVLGVAATPTSLTPAQQAAVNRRDNASRKAAASAARAAKLGQKSVAVAKKAAAALQKAKPIIDKLLAKKPKIQGPAIVHVHGDEDYVLGHDFFIGQDPTLDPSMQGLPPFTDPGSTGQSVDPSAYSDGGDIPLPVRGQSLSQDDASVVWSSGLPEDAVVYHGEHGWPAQSLGSWSRFYGLNGQGNQTLLDVMRALTEQNKVNRVDSAYTTGFAGDYMTYIQQNPDSALAKFQSYVVNPGYMWSDPGATPNDQGTGNVGWSVKQDPPDWNPILMRHDGGEIANWILPHAEPNWNDPNAMYWVGIAQDSMNKGWGPLIGNGPLAGLQFETSTGQWFWQSQNAPVWMTQAQDQQITALNQAANAAAQAAAAADQARQDQEANQQAEAQAAQDAQTSMTQQASDAQTQAAQAQLDQQQQQADAQAAAAQTALELQATKADLQYGMQQAAMQQQASQADLDYAIAHPELAIQEQQQAETQQPQYDDDGQPLDTDLAQNVADVQAFDQSSANPEDNSDVITDTTSADENAAAAADFDRMS